MRVKAALKASAAAPLRLVPARVRRRMVQALVHSLAHGSPSAALRWLFTIDDDLAFYVNDAATRYDKGSHAKHRVTRYHDFFVERIRPTDRVIDIGCGYGAVAYSVATRAGADVVGMDLDHNYIEQARARFHAPNLRFVLGDALTDLPDERFDVIVFSNVLEHLDSRVAFLRAVEARLRPRRWLIRVPMFDRDWRVPMRKELGLPYFSDVTHTIEYTTDTFAEEMGASGLTIVHLQVNWGEIWAEVHGQ